MSKYEFSFRQFCRKCFVKKQYGEILKEREQMKCNICKSTGTQLEFVYVNPDNWTEFVRDFRNSGHTLKGHKVMRCAHELHLKKEDHWTRCSYALNEFEDQMWNKMAEMKKYKVNEIFDDYKQYVLYKPWEIPSQNGYIQRNPIVREFVDERMIAQVPTNEDENKIIKKEEKSSSYICSFCFVEIKSEKKIQEHLDAATHKSNYEADKKRRWYFKMPPKKIGLCNCPGECEDDNCVLAHSIFEEEEMKARVKFRNKELCEKIKILPRQKYHDWPNLLTVSFFKFPPLLQMYQKKSLKTIVKVILHGDVKLHRVSLLYGNATVFFKLFSCSPNETILDDSKKLETKAPNTNIDKFGLEFEPLHSASFVQSLEFELTVGGERRFCQKVIQVDVSHMEQWNVLKDTWSTYEYMVETDTECKSVLPYSLTESSENQLAVVPVSELYDIFQIQSNPKWFSSSLANWNYVPLMRDMVLLEEMEQRRLVSELEFNDIAIQFTNVLPSNSEGTKYAQSGNLYGCVTYKPEDSWKAREIVKNTVTRAFIVHTVNGNKIAMECRLVDKFHFDMETRNIAEFWVNVPVTAIETMQAKTGLTIGALQIVLVSNRLQFNRRLRGLANVPHKDQLSYCPRPCPAFHHLPFGESSQSVQRVEPKANLNDCQKVLPRLVLRNIDDGELLLPFVLNGAFGTGKTFVIAETVLSVLRQHPTARILVCTRSYSAAEVFTEMFQRISEEKLPSSKSKVVYSDNYIKNFANLFRSRDVSVDLLSKEVLITTLDNVQDTFGRLLDETDTPKPMFQYIFVDEAAQVLEVDAIMVYQFGDGSTKFVFAGDLFQMRPIVYREDLSKMTVPITSRLYKFYMRCNDYKICLTHVYRTNGNIVKFLSDAIYCQTRHTAKPSYMGTMLTSASNSLPPYLTKSMQFKGHNSPMEFDGVLKSYRNVKEKDLIVQAVKFYVKISGGSENEKILVCCPFFSQVKLIRDNLRKEGLRDVVVELPSGIQGREFNAVFISTVLTESNPPQILNEQTFHNSKNLINQAISRAKHYVEVVGDEASLTSQKAGYQWKQFIEISKHL